MPSPCCLNAAWPACASICIFRQTAMQVVLDSRRLQTAVEQAAGSSGLTLGECLSVFLVRPAATALCCSLCLEKLECAVGVRPLLLVHATYSSFKLVTISTSYKTACHADVAFRCNSPPQCTSLPLRHASCDYSPLCGTRGGGRERCTHLCGSTHSGLH